MTSTDKNEIPAQGGEKFRGALHSRLRELGISAREASRRAGFNVGYVGDILEGRSKVPDAERVLKLAAVLEVDASDLLGESVASAFSDSRPGFGGDRRPANDSGAGRMLPLYSAPIPLLRPFLLYTEEPVGRTPCPPNLLENADGYAVTVPNSASAPRYFAGEVIFAAPGRTPKIGDFVFVRLTDGMAGAAQLSGLGSDSVRLHFWGLEEGERSVEIDVAKLAAMHVIVASITT